MAPIPLPTLQHMPALLCGWARRQVFALRARQGRQCLIKVWRQQREFDQKQQQMQQQLDQKQ